MVGVWKFLSGILIELGDLWSFLNTSIVDSLNLDAVTSLALKEAFGDWSFIQLFGVGGLTLILVFWIIKLLNPLS